VRESQAWLWDADTGDLVAVLEAVARVIWAGFSPDGRWIAQTATDGTGRLWDAETGGLLGTLEGYRSGLSDYRSMDFDLEGFARHLDKKQREGNSSILDLMPLHPIAGPQRERDRNWLAHAGFSGDGRRVAFASHDGTTRVVELSPEGLDGPLTPLLAAVRYGSILPSTGDIVYLGPAERTARRRNLNARLEAALADPAGPRRLAAALALLDTSPGHARAVEVVLIAIASGGRARSEALVALRTLAGSGKIDAEALDPSWRRALTARDATALKGLLAVLVRRGAGATERIAPLARAEADGVPPALRLDVVHALGLLGADDPRAVEALVALLPDPNDTVVAEAAQALGHLGRRAVSVVVARLGAADAKTRARALHLLETFGPDAREATPQLVRLLGHDDEATRVAAGKALVAIGSGVVPEVTAALRSPDEPARFHAAGVLADLAPESAPALPGLLAAVRDDPSERVRQDAARAIISLRNTSDSVTRRLRSTLLEGLNAKDGRTRRETVGIITRIDLIRDDLGSDQQSLGGRLRELLNGPDSSFCDFLVGGLLRIKAYEILSCHEPRGITALVGAIAELQGEDRARAALYLRIGAEKLHRDSIPVIARLLGVPDPEVRWAALDAIQSIGPAETPATPVLVRALKDPDSSVRVMACRVLLAVPGHEEQVIPVLADLIEHTEGILWMNQRKDAAGMLGGLGPKARAALPNLARALHALDRTWSDSDQTNYRQVQIDVVRAIATIDPANATAREALEKAWRTEDFDTSPRLLSAKVLAQAGFGSDEMVQFLAQVLTEPKLGFGDKPSDYWDDATAALVSLEPRLPKARAAVADFAARGSPGVRLALAAALLATGRDNDRAFPIFEAYLGNSYYELRQMACERLGHAASDPVRAVRLLIGRLTADKEHAKVRNAAAEALVKLGPGIEPVAGQLAPLLTDPDKEVRLQIIEALGPYQADGPGDVPYVLPALSDREEGVQLKAAGELLAHHRDRYAQTVIDHLLQLLETRFKSAPPTAPTSQPVSSDGQEPGGDDDPEEEPGEFDGEAEGALKLLAQLGPHARAALPRLQALRDLVPRENRETFERTLKALQIPIPSESAGGPTD
jgi:HEAT repeat protein